MKIFKFVLYSIFFITSTVIAQNEIKPERKPGHTNQNKFKQLYDEFATPNMFRTGSGAPGPGYYQQQADYKMDIEIDDVNARLYGDEIITYTNNSPDVLTYLWVQLDQNMRARDSKTPLINSSGIGPATTASRAVNSYLKERFDGGFNIEHVKDINNKDLPHIINRTMMRVELPEPMKTGDQFSFKIKWWYNINDHVKDGGRSGYEYFEENDNRIYVMAQFYPRMAVYNDVEGWQNSQFWGRDEFALPFGNFDVNITVPSDHILDGTGYLTNRKEVFTKDMMQRYNKAKKSFDKPVMIVTEEEARKTEKTKSKDKKTWKLSAQMVRDFGFATSRKFIWDMMAVKLDTKEVMAVSLYSKEGNPLWEQWSTRTVASTLKSYSRMTFDYPYHKAISVHAPMGMEYPMICYNFGRPDENGNYSDRTKFGMIGVIIHEVGHNWFPMIVNSDERQWTWMDEGLNTFVQYVAEQDFGEWNPTALSEGMTKYPSRRGPAKNIVRYMGGDQDFIAPIMTKGLNTYQFGSNAYSKPATGLNILRETIMGRDLFDYAFKEYANRWKFKHPTPEDFFRTMEDASAVDLDWFWRGWFYTTDYTDIAVKDVKKYIVTTKPNENGKRLAERYKRFGINPEDVIYFVAEGEEGYEEALSNPESLENLPTVKEYIMDNLTQEQQKELKETPKYFYQVTFDKPGGLVMPLIVQYKYADGTTEKVTYPAQIWRLNDQEVSRAIASDKEIVEITVDPDLETADVDTSNNSWPREVKESQFDQFKNSIKD
ncbi:M1 family metallopeptidase [Winogradskyella sp. DF17]|uniref:M1 family metallopeptidase n=1 Tax=Winogradskyella pelagia TaxID=2819984 RepID=A0ABS3T280_9FLAO|nr:M1 family metallopeptidase [Winogradskyella sp. DF17]MBO3115840.1 M1 family metallopeptidase [Winogradskyella sp. DF17]